MPDIEVGPMYDPWEDYPIDTLPGWAEATDAAEFGVRMPSDEVRD